MDKQLILNEQQAREALENHQNRLADLKAKRNAIETELPRLKDSIQQAEQAKADALEAYISNSLTRNEVDETQAAYNAAVEALTRGEELLKAITAKEQALVREIPPIQARHTTALQNLWGAISENIAAELKGNGSYEQLVMAFAAHRRSRRPRSFPAFLEWVFKEPTRAELDAKNPELEQIWEQSLNS